MGKKYPWQRWPDKDKTNKKGSYHGQSKPSSWSKSSIQQIKENVKDEAKGSRTYKRLAKKAPTPEEETTLNDMAADEQRHGEELEEMSE